jgi:nicotinamidase-related amidase
MRRGLEPRVHARARAAVLALDLITDFDFPDGPRVRRALARRAPALRRLLASARSHGIPVIYVNDNLGPWRSDSPALVAHCTANGAGAGLVASLAPAESDFIVLKPRHSAFFGTPLDALLTDLKVGTLILVGVSAESCVWMTACDAHTRGLQLLVPVDSIAGASSRALRATLIGLREVLGARTPRRSASLRLGRGRVLQRVVRPTSD